MDQSSSPLTVKELKLYLSEAKHGQAKLSIDAPEEVLTLREELE